MNLVFYYLVAHFNAKKLDNLIVSFRGDSNSRDESRTIQMNEKAQIIHHLRDKQLTAKRTFWGIFTPACCDIKRRPRRDTKSSRAPRKRSRTMRSAESKGKSPAEETQLPRVMLVP